MARRGQMYYQNGLYAWSYEEYLRLLITLDSQNAEADSNSMKAQGAGIQTTSGVRDRALFSLWEAAYRAGRPDLLEKSWLFFPTSNNITDSKERDAWRRWYRAFQARLRYNQEEFGRAATILNKEVGAPRRVSGPDWLPALAFFNQWAGSLKNNRLYLAKYVTETPRETQAGIGKNEKAELLENEKVLEELPPPLTTPGLLESTTGGELRRLWSDYRDWWRAERKSPWLAGSLSGLVPGTGHFYAGRDSDGWTSLGAVVVFGGLSVLAFREGSATFGTISALGAAAFYTGGIYGAARAAHHYNLRAEEKYYFTFRHILLDEYRSPWREP